MCRTKTVAAIALTIRIMRLTQLNRVILKIILSNINDRVQFHTVLFHRCHLWSVYYLGQSNVPSALLFYDPGVSKRKGNVLRIHKGINL